MQSLTDPTSYFDREYFELHEGKKLYLDHLITLLKTHGILSGKVCDIGAGFGFFLERLSQDGYQSVGVELSEFAAKIAQDRSGAKVVVQSAEAGLPFIDDDFDAVVMTDVIEHLREYEGVLAEIHRVLKPGGLALITTLNKWSIARFLLGHSWSWYKDPSHIHMFSLGMLRGALCRAKFNSIQGWPFFNFCLVGETTKSLRFLRRLGTWAYCPLFGDSIVICARK